MDDSKSPQSGTPGTQATAGGLMSNEGDGGSQNSTPPPSFAELHFQLQHLSLQRFGGDLQAAANAVFPNDASRRSRYSKVFGVNVVMG
jgi:hypothetical protein